MRKIYKKRIVRGPFGTAIEAEILYQALYVHVQRLNTSLTKCQTRYCMEPRPSVDDCKVMRFLGAFIKPVHPCTGLIARFAQQNALLLRTTDIRVGTEKKTPRKQSSSGKKIEAESAVLHFVFFEVIVNKMQQSAKKARNKNNKSSLPEFFRLRQGLPEAEKRCLLKRGGADTRR